MKKNPLRLILRFSKDDAVTKITKHRIKAEEPSMARLAQKAGAIVFRALAPVKFKTETLQGMRLRRRHLPLSWLLR
jgi:hypothetical protein